jgi:hypothetical protein
MLELDRVEFLVEGLFFCRNFSCLKPIVIEILQSIFT